MARKKSEKVLTAAQEMKRLREPHPGGPGRGQGDDAPRIDLLVKRLAVLEAKRRLDRAERALVKSVIEDHGNPQLELLGQNVIPTVAQADGDAGNPSADGPLFDAHAAGASPALSSRGRR